MALFTKSNKKKNKGSVSKKKLPRTVQETIPYTRIFSNGTIETKPDHYTRSYALEDINFKIAPDEQQVAIFRAYGDLLNTFPETVEFQTMILNLETDKRISLKDISFRLQAGDGLDRYRQEMNSILLDKMSEGGKNIEQVKVLTVSIEDEELTHAMVRLDNLEKDIIKGVRRINKDVKIERMSIEDRLEILFNIYNQDGQSIFYNDLKKDGETPYFNYYKLGKNGIDSKDIIGPSGIEFKPNFFTMGEFYGSSLYLEKVPTWLSTEFISDLSDIAANLSISVTHKPIDTSKAMKMVKDQMMDINGQIARNQKEAVKSGYSYDLLSPELMRSQQQTRDLMKDIVGRDQKMYYVSFVITAFAESKNKLDEVVRQIQSISNKHISPMKYLTYQQEQGLNTSLPLCLNELSVNRLYTTESASIFMPYTTLELHQKNGIFYGLNEASNNMILYDRLSGRNYNGLIFGESGNGKSMTAKIEMVNALLRSTKNEVHVIDPESEYAPLALSLGGEVIDLSPGSKTYINPLDMDIDYDGESDPVSMKLDYIVSMVEIMLGKDRALDPQAKSILGRCVNNIYAPYIDHINSLRKRGYDITFDRNAMPTLNTLYNELDRQPEPQAETIKNIIEVYATGSFATFSHRSNVETQTRFVVYDIKNLGTGMKDLGLHVCLNEIWNKMISNRKKGIYTWIYIDEFYLLLQSESAAKFLMQVWKRARKWYGVPTGIMQNTEDLLRSADSRNIINNTSFIQMLSLPKIDRTNLGELLQIPDTQLEYITNSERGHGLIYNGKTIIPFNNEFPTDTELFKLMDSSGKSDDALSKIMDETNRRRNAQKERPR